MSFDNPQHPAPISAGIERAGAAHAATNTTGERAKTMAKVTTAFIH